MMPGSFSRVVTVTHQMPAPGMGRMKGGTVRAVEIRDAHPMDAPPAWHWYKRWPAEGLAGPCGTVVQESERSGMFWTCARLAEYHRDHGANPLGRTISKGKARGTAGRGTWYEKQAVL